MRVLTPTFPERGIHAGLADRALVRSEIYIAGEWRKANDGGLLFVRNPATGEWIGSVAAAGPDETVAAIAAAGIWSRRSRRSVPISRSTNGCDRGTWGMVLTSVTSRMRKLAFQR